MADSSSSPLLAENLSESEVHSAEDAACFASVDDAIEACVGAFGPAQLLQATLVSTAWAFDAQQTFIAVFTDAQPKPPEGCVPGGDTRTIVSEWGLACAPPFVRGLPSSCFFAGCLVGGILFATLADSRLGRKNMLLASCLIMSVAGVLTAFSPDVWVYSALRFVSGIGRATIGTRALVLSTEISGRKWRGQVGIIGFFCFTLGFLSLPAAAFLTRTSSWRILYLLASIPTILYCILIKFAVHESPRWLLVRGRKDEAVQTLIAIAKFNRKTTAAASFSNMNAVQEESCGSSDLYSSLQILWRKRWAFRRLSTIMVASFGMGFVYYGLPLGAGNLSFNLYLSVTFNALAEFPSALLTLLMIGRIRRKPSILALATVSGLSSILCVFLGVGGERRKGLQMLMEVISFFSAFNFLLIYSLELFRTSVRNSALSMVRQALVLGGVFCPLLVATGRDGLLSYGVFGVVIAGCGMFITCLPETRKGGFSDTMEEEERRGKTECSP